MILQYIIKPQKIQPLAQAWLKRITISANKKHQPQGLVNEDSWVFQSLLWNIRALCA